jgi:D-glycero-D-manno-heptose 1,7-bisphosphate phosphatase
MNPRPAVFFDRDNTLIAADGYLGDPAGVTLVDGAAELVAKVRTLGFATVVFSNQSGVARGMFGEDDVRAVNARFGELLKLADPAALIDRHEYCPFHPEGTVEAFRKESDLRKPRPGMIYQAAAALGLDVGKSWVVGDAPRDIEAGKVAGCRTILVKDPSLKLSPAAEAAPVVVPDFVVTSLSEAGEVIDRETAKSDHTPPYSTAPASPDVQQKRSATPSQGPAITGGSLTRADVATGDARAPSAAPRKESGRRVAAKDRAVTTSEHPTARVEQLLEEVLDELRRREDVRSDFSIAKLIAGIVQVIALASLFVAYLRRDSPSLEPTLLTALVFQALTIALLIMERQRV